MWSLLSCSKVFSVHCHLVRLCCTYSNVVLHYWHHEKQHQALSTTPSIACLHSLPTPPTHPPTAALSEGQRAAIHAAATAPVVVITGGPGCGKTQVVGALVHLWQDMHRSRVTWLTGEEEGQLRALQGRGAEERHSHEGRRTHIRLAAPTGARADVIECDVNGCD